MKNFNAWLNAAEKVGYLDSALFEDGVYTLSQGKKSLQLMKKDDECLLWSSAVPDSLRKVVGSGVEKVLPRLVVSFFTGVKDASFTDTDNNTTKYKDVGFFPSKVVSGKVEFSDHAGRTWVCQSSNVPEITLKLYKNLMDACADHSLILLPGLYPRSAVKVFSGVDGSEEKAEEESVAIMSSVEELERSIPNLQEYLLFPKEGTAPAYGTAIVSGLVVSSADKRFVEQANRETAQFLNSAQRIQSGGGYDSTFENAVRYFQKLIAKSGKNRHEVSLQDVQFQIPDRLLKEWYKRSGGTFADDRVWDAFEEAKKRVPTTGSSQSGKGYSDFDYYEDEVEFPFSSAKHLQSGASKGSSNKKPVKSGFGIFYNTFYPESGPSPDDSLDLIDWVETEEEARAYVEDAEGGVNGIYPSHFHYEPMDRPEKLPNEVWDEAQARNKEMWDKHSAGLISDDELNHYFYGDDESTFSSTRRIQSGEKKAVGEEVSFLADGFVQKGTITGVHLHPSRSNTFDIAGSSGKVYEGVQEKNIQSGESKLNIPALVSSAEIFKLKLNDAGTFHIDMGSIQNDHEVYSSLKGICDAGQLLSIGRKAGFTYTDIASGVDFTGSAVLPELKKFLVASAKFQLVPDPAINRTVASWVISGKELDGELGKWGLKNPGGVFSAVQVLGVDLDGTSKFKVPVKSGFLHEGSSPEEVAYSGASRGSATKKPVKSNVSDDDSPYVKPEYELVPVTSIQVGSTILDPYGYGLCVVDEIVPVSSNEIKFIKHYTVSPETQGSLSFRPNETVYLVSGPNSYGDIYSSASKGRLSSGGSRLGFKRPVASGNGQVESGFESGGQEMNAEELANWLYLTHSDVYENPKRSAGDLASTFYANHDIYKALEFYQEVFKGRPSVSIPTMKEAFSILRDKVDSKFPDLRSLSSSGGRSHLGFKRPVAGSNGRLNSDFYDDFGDSWGSEGELVEDDVASIVDDLLKKPEVVHGFKDPVDGSVDRNEIEMLIKQALSMDDVNEFVQWAKDQGYFRMMAYFWHFARGEIKPSSPFVE